MPGLKNGILPTGSAAAACTCRCHGEKASPVHGYLHSMVEIGLLKILLDHEILDAIPDDGDDDSDGSGNGISIAELAARTGAEPGLLRRFADFLIAARFLSSQGQNQNSNSQDRNQDRYQDRGQGLQQGEQEQEGGGRRVAHTALSRSIVRDADARSLFSHAFDFLLIPATEWSEYFDSHGLAEPGNTTGSPPSDVPCSPETARRRDTTNGDGSGGARAGSGPERMTTPFALAAGRPQSSPREVLETMPRRAESLWRVFDAAFGGAGTETLYDFSWVGDYVAATTVAPLDEEGSSGDEFGGSGSDRALIVDVGGDDERALRGILDSEPRIPAGKCVLQGGADAIRAEDVSITNGTEPVKGGGLPPFKKMAGDMFAEQPIKGLPRHFSHSTYPPYSS